MHVCVLEGVLIIVRGKLAAECTHEFSSSSPPARAVDGMWAGQGRATGAVAMAFSWEWLLEPHPPGLLHNRSMFANMTIGGTRAVEDNLSVHTPTSP